MKIEYFPDTGNLYIDLADRPGSDSLEIGERIILDIGEQVDGLLGIVHKPDTNRKSAYPPQFFS